MPPVAEYYIDVDEFTSDMRNFLLSNGATEVDRKNYYGSRFSYETTDLYFGRRKTHFLVGSNSARIFVDETTMNAALLFVLKWHNNICRHTLPEEPILS